MITYCKKGRRHTISMSEDEFVYFAQHIWLAHHTQPVVGFNRKNPTPGQREVVDKIFQKIPFSPDFGEMLNRFNDQ